MSVLNFQHDVAVAAYGLLDGAKGTLSDAVSTTIFAALDRRDQAAVYIHTGPCPAAAAGPRPCEQPRTRTPRREPRRRSPR